MRWNGKWIVRWCQRNPNIAKTFKENSHWRKLSMIMVWERYCNASPKPEFFLFSLFIISFISQLIWGRLGWNFHRWFSIQKQVNWCTIDPFSLKFCTSQSPTLLPSTLILGNWQSQNKWGMVSTVNEQKEHKFESIKPILQVYSLTPNILCNNWYWKYLNLVERLDFNGERYASFQSKEISFSFQTTSPGKSGSWKYYQQVVFEQTYRPFEFSLFL